MAHQRKSIPVDTETQELLRALRENDSREHAALTSLARGAEAEANGRWSEAAVLAALIDLGKQALQEKVLELEYRAMAAEQGEADEERTARDALRRRRRLSPRAGE